MTKTNNDTTTPATTRKKRKYTRRKAAGFAQTNRERVSAVTGGSRNIPSVLAAYRNELTRLQADIKTLQAFIGA